MCQPHATFGFQSTNNGGMAEYFRYPKTAVLHRVPEDMPLEKALLVEPYACSKHCVDRAQITNEDVVVISGAGTLGMGMVTYARMKNPAKLIVLDMMDARLEKAKEFGADLVWNPSKVDVVAEIMKLTDGYGCDIYIEATGHPSSVTQGMNMIRKLGRFVEFSVFGAPTTLDWSVIGDGKELDVLGSQLCAVMAALAVGMRILADEQVRIDRLTGHGGIFKTPGVAQRYLAAAMGAPVSVMAEAGEGGPYGMALLAQYLTVHASGKTLEDFLQEDVFRTEDSSVYVPTPTECAAYRRYLEQHHRGLAAEHAAVDSLLSNQKCPII